MPAVILAPSDPSWPATFTAVREELVTALGPVAARIEHVGSTSVPGLSAKPVIDVLVGAASLAAIESRIRALAEAGYGYVPTHEGVLPERRYFVKESVRGLRVHVHAVVEGGPFWRDHLAFRDALRSDPATRAAYEALKRELAARHADDKAAYTDAKGPFVRSVVARARS